MYFIISSEQKYFILKCIIKQQQFQLIKLSCSNRKMENDLIMNHIPLPKYYDGNEWNTVMKPTRKSIPKYLHQDLPELRHLYIKQMFKDMGKFNVPNLEFFNDMIKQKTKKAEKRQVSSLSNSGRNKKFSYNQVKEQLQYALLVTDRKSNIVDELVQKAQKVQQGSINRKGHRSLSSKTNKLQSQQGGQTFRSRKPNKNVLVKQNTRAKYFENTVDLVFRNRRNKYIQSLKKPIQYNEQPQAYEKRFKQLGLVDIQNPNL